MSEDDVGTVDERGSSGRDRGSATEPAAADAPAAANPEPPARDSTRYRRGAEIARGGMGRVVEAEDELLGRTVAVKETLELDDDARRRFEREVRITARLEHPSIVPVYDAGRGPTGLPFYVMRRLSGRPLDQIIRAAAGLDERLTLLPNLLGVLDAVGHAHRRGIIHRDLKPANVLVGELGETVVIDWGLAKVIGEAEAAVGAPLPALGDASTDKTVAGTVVGTPGFMAPEQAIAEAVDARSDVYSLGATMYYLLAGRPPYAGSNASEVLDRMVAEPPAPLPSLAPGVPPDLVTLVDKAMAFEPARRYPDAAAMGEDLRRFLAGQLVAAHHYSTGQRLARFVRRYRAVLAVVVAAIVTVAAIGALSLRRILADRDRISAARAAAEAGRTDAVAKSRELRRLADGLIVDQARNTLAVDPSLAVAMIKQLPADSERWPAARAVIAEARIRGIAFALPGHDLLISSLELAGDNRHLLSLGADGELAVHDLTLRTTNRIAHDLAPTDRIRWFGDAIAILRYATHELVVIDATTGAAQRTLSTTAVAMNVAFDGTLAWCDTDGSVHLVTPGQAAIVVDAAAGATWVSLSPQASWLQVSGPTIQGSRLYHRTGARWDRSASLPETTTALASSFDDSRIAFRAGEQIVEWSLTGPHPAELRRLPGKDTYLVAYAGNQLFSAEVGTTLEWSDRSSDTRRLIMTTTDVRITQAVSTLGDGLFVIAGGRDGARVTLATPGGPIGLHTTDTVDRVVGRVGCHWLAGSAGNHVLVWDLDEILPASISIGPAMTTIDQVGPNHVAASGAFQSVVLDLRTGQTKTRPPVTGPNGFTADGSTGVILRFMPDDRFEVVDVEAGWTARQVTIPGTTYLAARSLDTLVAADQDGRVVEVDVATGRSHEVARLGAPPVQADNQGAWVMMRTAATVWRGDGTIAEALAVPDMTAAAIGGDGTIYAIAGGTIVRWARGASVATQVARPPVVFAKLAVPPRPDRIYGLAEDNGMWQVDPITRTLGQILPAVQNTPRISQDGRCATAIRDGMIVIADLERETWWTLGVADHTGAVPGPDCRMIYTISFHNELEAWDVGLPEDSDGLHRWLEARTNARASASHGVIEWVLPPS